MCHPSPRVEQRPPLWCPRGQCLPSIAPSLFFYSISSDRPRSCWLMTRGAPEQEVRISNNTAVQFNLNPAPSHFSIRLLPLFTDLQVSWLLRCSINRTAELQPQDLCDCYFLCQQQWFSTHFWNTRSATRTSKTCAIGLFSQGHWPLFP